MRTNWTVCKDGEKVLKGAGQRDQLIGQAHHGEE